MATSTSPVRDDGRSPAAATSVAAATTASPSEPSADGTDSVRLHVRCSRFPKFTTEELALALRELCGPDIQIRDVFKKKIWEFSFVEVGSVQEELLFREKLEGAKTFQGADVAVKRAERRKNDDEGAPKAKRRKKNGNAGPGADADAVPRTEEDGFSQQRPDRNHLGFKHDVLPTLAELTNKLKTFGKQKNLSVVDRTAPLFKLYNYGAQKRIKHSHCKSTCKAVLKKVAGAAREDNKPIPGWADIERSGHGIGLEPLVGWPTSTSGVEQEDSAGAASPGEVDSSAVGQEDATTPLGYRNKMEMTLGQSALSPTDFEVGFVQRMDQNNEQQVGAPDDLPHIPATGKKLAKILREIVVESGLPVYRRHKEVRAGFWRIVMCRVSDLDVKQSGAHVLPVPDSQQPMQLVIQVTKFNHPTFLNTLIRLLRKHLVEGKNGGGCAEVGVKVESIYIQMNDGMSDAFELNGEVKEFYGDEGAGGSSLYTLLEDLKSGSASLSDEDVAQAEFLQGLRSNKYFNDGELFEKDLSPVARRGFVGNAGADAGEPTDAGVSADAVSADAVSADPDAVSADAPGVPAVDSIVTVTPTGNLLRPRTKNERKKGKNLNTNPEPALYHVFGKKEIDMHVCGLSFAVGPAAFFQTNSIVTQRLYEKALTWAVEPRLGLVDRTGRAGHFLGLVGEGGKKAMSVGSCGEEASSAISGESEPVLVLDVCSGVGTIGCVAARKLPHCQVVGVEIVPKAVESANGNAQRNGLQNCQFLAGPAETVLPKVFRFLQIHGGKKLSEIPCPSEEEQEVTGVGGPFPPLNCKATFAKLLGGEDNAVLPVYKQIVAIVDPPRGGLHKDVCLALKRNLAISKLVYISCNPETLATNLLSLSSPQDEFFYERGLERYAAAQQTNTPAPDDTPGDFFVPRKAVGVDMFPHTLHCEMVLALDRYVPSFHEGLYQGRPMWKEKRDREEAEKRDLAETEKRAAAGRAQEEK